MTATEAPSTSRLAAELILRIVGGFGFGIVGPRCSLSTTTPATRETSQDQGPRFPTPGSVVAPRGVDQGATAQVRPSQACVWVMLRRSRPGKHGSLPALRCRWPPGPPYKARWRN